MKIVQYPHPILAYKSKPIKKIDQKLRDLIAEMFDLMYSAEGVGLAANQVELPYQLLVMNPTGDSEQKGEEYALINPVITKRSGGLKEFQEGCLSFPDLQLQISRPAEVAFQAIDLSGRLCRYSWKGIHARIIQHESDHLNGQCFYQKATLSGEMKAKPILDSLAESYAFDKSRGFIPTDAELADRIAEWEKERT